MNGRKHSVIIALILIIAGLLAAGASLASVGFDLSKLSTETYVTRTIEVNGDFSSITVAGDTEDIVFASSDDGMCRVVCREPEDEPHRAEASDGTLTIESTGRNRWHFFSFGFLAEGPSVTVYLPGKDYNALDVQSDTGDLMLPEDITFDSVNIRLSTGGVDCMASVQGLLSVRTSTGHIVLSGMSANAIQLSAGTGDVRIAYAECPGGIEISTGTGETVLDSVTCRELVSTGSTGSLTMKNVIASGAFNLRRSTGSIRFDACDAAEITARTDTGSVKGSLLTGKTFSAHSGTGSVDVPESAAGGRCEVSTDTGSIRIEVSGSP